MSALAERKFAMLKQPTTVDDLPEREVKFAVRKPKTNRKRHFRSPLNDVLCEEKIVQPVSLL